jgi:hypothetical protein
MPLDEVDVEDQVATEDFDDDDDGSIADLIDLFADDESDDGESTEEESAAEAPEPAPDGDTPEEAPSDVADTATGGEIPELERLRQENEAHRQIQARAQQQYLQQQQEQRRQETERQLKNRFESLDDLPDPELRDRERGAILQDVRNQERNVFLPQLNALEQEKETAAQGLVALHYATEMYLKDIADGVIDVSKVTPDQMLATIQGSAIEYMEYENAADMQREIAKRNEIKSQANAENRRLAAENQKLKQQLQAAKIARNPVHNGGGTGRGNASMQRGPGKLAEDEGTIRDLLDEIFDDPEESEVVATGTGNY